MVIRTNHTVLAQIASHNSGGKAKVICGFKSLMEGFTDQQLTSSKFRKFKVGKVVIATVMLSGSRRLTQTIFENATYNVGDMTEDMIIGHFVKNNSETLRTQSERYYLSHGLPTPVTNELGLIINGKVPASQTKKKDEPTVELEPKEVALGEGKIYIERTVRKLYETIYNISRQKHIAVMMVGPSGYGKTSIPRQIAEEYGMGFHRQDCSTVRDPEEFYGYRGAKDGSTIDEGGQQIFIETEFTKRVREGNCIIVLDEINRTDPYILNSMFPLLDHDGRTRILNHEIVVGPNVIFVGTMNVGYQFTGTFQIDTALSNRFIASIQVGPLPKAKEVKILMERSGVSEPIAEKIVNVVNALRKVAKKGSMTADVSTRVSIQIAELVAFGLDMRNAFLFNVVNTLSQEEAKEVLDIVGTLI